VDKREGYRSSAAGAICLIIVCLVILGTA